jgi:hypothetical protein
MKRILPAILTVAAVIAMPSPVAAGEPATFCDYTAANHRVTVQIVGSPTHTVISRDGLGHINLDGTWCDATATVTNTDGIIVTGDGDLQTLVIELANKGFKPGFTNEAGKSDEIEFTIDLGPGSDTLFINGTNAVQKVDFGQGNSQFVVVRRINLNSAESTGVDTDVSVTGVEVFGIDVMGGNDRVRAQGKQGTGPDPFGLPLQVYGGDGNDVIRGGPAGDDLFGGLGLDEIWGNGGPDTIHLIDFAGGDIGHGGPGTDVCEKDNGDTCYAN